VRRRGTGSVYPHRDGFRAQRVVAGRRVSLGVYATQDEADGALEYTLRSGRAVRGVPLVHWGLEVIDRRERAGRRDTDAERSRWAVHVEGSELGELVVREVTRADVEHWLERVLLAEAKPGKGQRRNARRISRGTASNVLTLLRVVLEEAARRGVAASNVAREVRLPRPTGRTHEPWTYLTPPEQNALLRACRRDELAVVAFALSTGLRQGEQWALRADDVDLDAERVTVRFGSPGKPPKNGRIRRVPLLPLAVGAARAALRRGHELAFPNRLGSSRSKGEPSWWPALVARAKLGRHVRWHDLRHTCASSLVAGWWGRAWRLEEVCAYLGHSSIKVTERYAHLAGTILEQAAAEHRAIHPSAHGAHTPRKLPSRKLARKPGSHLRDLNSRPTVYETVALPLS
jgi:integrase